eukprot:Colp12_sorted_trinity150504_noHs@1682
MRFAALAFVVCLAGTVVASTLPWVHVDTNTHNFVDEYNRTVLLHGINIVYKLSPFLPPETKKFNVNNSLSDDDFELLRKWGFNLVRLGFIWEGFEREPGKYNYEYLERMKGVVRKLARKGIYTIIDNHQDLLSPFFCGEGLPEYMATLLSPENKNMSLFPAPTDLDLRRDPKTGYPLPEDCKKVPGPGFGSTDNTPSGLRHIKVLADIADTKLQSWAYWQYKLYDDISTTSVLQGMFDESGPVEGKVHALARPYPMATQGLLQSVNFNAENTTFTFTFTANPSIRAPTEVYLGAHNFPAGCHVAVMPRMTTHFYLSENLNRLTVKLHKWVKPETPITVTVTAPQPSA